MIINIIADGLKAPAKKIARKLHKTEKAIYAKVLQELILIKSKVNTTKGGLVWMAHAQCGNFKNFLPLTA